MPLHVTGHQTMLLPPRSSGTYEATLQHLSDGRVALFHELDGILQMRTSGDAGRTWSESVPLVTAAGAAISGLRTSPVRLESGRLGLFHTGARMRPGRDGKLVFRVSADEGRTWSDGVDVDPLFAVLRSDGGRVLPGGRLIAPVFCWISAYTGGESEAPSHGFCYSWVYWSDDEGETWHRSLSELAVAENEGRGGVYQFEEPVVETLTDGRLLMLGRTELGRHYVSVSEDRGVAWSVPVPGSVAAGYTPTLLRRIPATADLLMIWNQVVPEEQPLGLARHRLSCAISDDDGQSWKCFRNLESLDDRTCLEPPPAVPLQVYRRPTGTVYRQPEDVHRFPHAPGPLRVCYPSVAFVENEVLIAYDCDDTTGAKRGAPLNGRHGTKLRILPLKWFYANQDGPRMPASAGNGENRA